MNGLIHGRFAADTDNRPIKVGANGQLLVGGDTGVVVQDLTVDTAAYVAGDSLMDLEDFASALSSDGGTGILQEFTLLDSGDQGSAIDLLFFSKTLTVTAKNAAWAVSDADMDACIGIVSIAAADWVDLGSNRIVTKSNISLGLFNNDTAPGKSIYVAAVCQGTPTFAAASDLRLKLTILRD